MDDPPAVFRPEAAERNRSRNIVTLGTYLRAADTLEAHGRARFVREAGAAYSTGSVDTGTIEDNRADLAHTRLVAAMNAGRVWARKRFVEWLDPLLEPGIAVCVVPPHDPFTPEPPLRLLAQALAARNGRTDATACLVRHTAIRRIVFGGASTVAIHRESMRVDSPELIQGRTVLLLDDVAKSGVSLLTCRMLLLEAGAGRVQAVALGRVR